MKHLVNFFILVCALNLAACYEVEAKANGALNLKDTLTIISAESGDKFEFEVELALNPEQQQNGLMGRTGLAADKGMLFWFGGEEVEKSFWMKNTLIPLDLVFIKRDGTIHHIFHNAIPHDLTPIPSKGPVAGVLEIPGGRSKQLGLQAGDRVEQRFFKNAKNRINK